MQHPRRAHTRHAAPACRQGSRLSLCTANVTRVGEVRSRADAACQMPSGRARGTPERHCRCWSRFLRTGTRALLRRRTPHHPPAVPCVRDRFGLKLHRMFVFRTVGPLCRSQPSCLNALTRTSNSLSPPPAQQLASRLAGTRQPQHPETSAVTGPHPTPAQRDLGVVICTEIALEEWKIKN